MLLKTPSGYVQQSPWLSISNKQLELMGRFMAELGLTPSARSRLAQKGQGPAEVPQTFTKIVLAPLRPELTVEGTVVPRKQDGPAIEVTFDDDDT